MNRNYVFSGVNDALPVLMGDLLNADEVGSRAGRTFEMTHVGITLLKPWQREIVLPSRKANIAAQIAETMWVLSGRTDVEWLARYLPRAVDFSDDGLVWRAGYGQRLRNYHGVDQLDYLIGQMMSNPGTRQAVATIWDPTVDTTPGKDIACNNWLHLLSRKGKVDLMVGIRSNDAMWGWSGINAFEWSALLEIVAGMAGLEVGSLHFATGSFHLYDQHWSKASRIAGEKGNWLYDDSPRFNATGLDDIRSLDELFRQWFEIEHEIRHGKARESSIDDFPEPMLQSWLRVLQWWWTGDQSYLVPLRHTRLWQACMVGVQPKNNDPQAAEEQLKIELSSADSFVDFVDRLHTEKHNAYGDSWKRRGEYMILANIARKIDRLEGGTDTPDETQTDTAIDLLVYLCKYHAWMQGLEGDPADVRRLLVKLHLEHIQGQTFPEAGLINLFTDLEVAFDLTPEQRQAVVQEMLPQAYGLAWSRWTK